MQEQELNEAEATIEARQLLYGNFSQNAEKLLSMTNALDFPKSAPEAIQVAVFMILVKLSRAANGDVTHRDTWVDIAGYATLVLKHLDEIQRRKAENSNTPPF